MKTANKYLSLLEEQVVVGSSDSNDEYYISKLSDEYFNSLSVLVSPFFIEETVPEEYAALRNIFERFGADWRCDNLWSIVVGVGEYELQDYINSVEKSEFHSHEHMDAFFDEVATAVNTVCETFKNLTSLDIDIIMTYDDPYESIPYGQQEILPYYGPNFAINCATEITTIDTIDPYKDEMSIYLSNM